MQRITVCQETTENQLGYSHTQCAAGAEAKITENVPFFALWREAWIPDFDKHSR